MGGWGRPRHRVSGADLAALSVSEDVERLVGVYASWTTLRTAWSIATGGVALEDVAAHVDAGGAVLDRSAGHGQRVELRSFLPPAITTGTGQPAVTSSKPSSQ